MRAIDTNIIVRFLTADDKKQAQTARAVIEAGDIFVSMTVLLESEWVLRSGYGFSVGQVVKGLSDFAGLPGINVESPLLLAQALDWMLEGMDFADALHVAKSDGCATFLTFDRKLIKVAKGRSPTMVEAP